MGTLNLNANLIKAGVKFSSIWSKYFTDEFLLNGIRQWLNTGTINHDTSHGRPLDLSIMPNEEVELGNSLAKFLKHEKAIFCVFDEGCMDMYNAIINDELLNPAGNLQGTIKPVRAFAEIHNVKNSETQAFRDWLDKHGMKFHTGPDPKKSLTNDQILE